MLIAEDKVRMALLLERAVQREGYLTMRAHDGCAALEIVQQNHLDAIVLDVMMPKLDGFAVLSRMRSCNIKVPTILLTAKDSGRDIVRGLDLGADDYLTKPFDLVVLMARLRALTRRSPHLVLGHLQVGNLVLHRNSHDAAVDGKVISLTPTEFTLLEVLMQRTGHIVRKETLAEFGWGTNEDFNEATLYVFMRSLRNKLHAAGQPSMLHTIRGVGYMLKCATAE